MSEKRHNELIDHISKTLYKHEEPYSPGAWEGFRHHKKKKSRISMAKTALSVAASIIFLLSLIFVLNDRERRTPQKPITEHQIEGNTSKSGGGEGKAPVPSTGDKKFSVTLYKDKETSNERPESNGSLASKDEPATSLSNNTLTTISRSLQQPESVFLSAEIASGLPEMQIGAEPPVGHVWPETDREKNPEKIVAETKSKNFSFGLTYAPLMNANDTKTDWSMGGGLYTEWNFARDLALSSGVLIAQNQLEYGREENMEGIGTNNLAHIQVDLVSLEIPLNLRYFLTDNISVSAGISSAAFLKEHYNYTYEYQREIQTLQHTEDSGFEPVTTEITFTETDRQSEPSLNAVKWAAFYTFSLGYQYDIAGKHTLSLEPFVKLPSGRLTSRHIKYYTGGLQMKISF